MCSGVLRDKRGAGIIICDIPQYTREDFWLVETSSAMARGRCSMSEIYYSFWQSACLLLWNVWTVFCYVFCLWIPLSEFLCWPLALRQSRGNEGGGAEAGYNNGICLLVSASDYCGCTEAVHVPCHLPSCIMWFHLCGIKKVSMLSEKSETFNFRQHRMNIVFS